MNLKRFTTNLALLLLLFGVWVSLANDHQFAQPGRAKAAPAPLDQQVTGNYQTATFGLG